MPGVTGVREEEKRRGDTSGLVRHSVYNLLGQMLPMLVAAVSIPVVVSGLGVERCHVVEPSINLVCAHYGRILSVSQG